MFRAKIYDNNNIIFDLHAEETFLKIGKLDLPEGIYVKHISNKPLDNIKSEIDEISQKNIFIDFHHIKSIQQNQKNCLKEILKNIIKKNKSFYLTNLQGIVKTQLDILPIFNELNINDNDINESDNILTLVKFDTISDFSKLKIDIFEKKLIDLLKKNTKTYNKQHPSSPVRLKKYIDIKGIIHEKTFLYYAIYNLALKIIEKEFLTQKSEAVLFCQTLNGAFIGSFLAELLRKDIIFLDHIGPINKLYSPHLSDRIDPGKEYIVISDVVCLGSEVNIAENIIQYRGGIYKGNCNIVRIKTLQDLSYKNECSLYILEPDNNILNYSIETDLTPKQEC